jgi:nicotinamidase-related amidase
MSLDLRIEPQRTALLMMDYQPSILGALPDTGRLLSVARAGIDHVRSIGGRVGYVRVAFDHGDIARFPPNSMMGARIKSAGRAMHVDSPTTTVHPDLGPQPGDLVMRKVRVGAFSTTDLHAQLQAVGVENLILAGVHTSGVVLTTVREAHDLDYLVVVLSDACADPDPSVHDFLIEHIFPKQSYCTTSDSLPLLFGTNSAR